eukprot:2056831-Pyramimonas_sp.AAC.1
MVASRCVFLDGDPLLRWGGPGPEEESLDLPIGRPPDPPHPAVRRLAAVPGRRNRRSPQHLRVAPRSASAAATFYIQQPERLVYVVELF